MRTALFSFVLLVPIVLGLWAAIGVYVYRDAKRRAMNPAAWTLIALLTPGLIGFIIYLLVRSSYSDLECPRCAAPVSEDYVVCPQCGARLRPACPSCAAPVEPDWKVCPRCAAPLEGVQMDAAPPRRRQDRTLNKILIAIIVVPVLLIVCSILGVIIFHASGGRAGSTALQELTFDEYDQYQTSETVKNAVHSWLDGLEVREDQAYALRYDYYSELDDASKHYFLIYVPAGGGQSDVGFGLGSGLFGPTLKLDLERTGDSGSLFGLEVRGAERPPKPKITLGGSSIRCDVREVDYNPTTFFILPDYSQPETEGAQVLPHSMSILRLGRAYIDGAGRANVEDPDMLRKLMACIDGGEQLPDSHPIYSGTSETLQDGFSILIQYPDRHSKQEGLQHDFAFLIAYRQDGVCYLNDSRIRSGNHIRRMDPEFYALLESLF